MKLARKLTLSLLAGVLLVVTLYGWVSIGSQSRRLEATMASELSVLARSTAAAVRRLAEHGAIESVDRFLAETTPRGSDVQVRWISLAPSPTSERAPLATSAALATLAPDHELVETTRDRLIVVHRLTGALADTALEASGALDVVHAAKRQVVFRTISAAATIVFLGAAYFVAVGFWFIGKPVQALTAHLRRIGEHEAPGHVEPSSSDELGELAGELNQLTDRLREERARLQAEQAARVATVEQLRHADRLSMVGQLAAGIAHELGTPLNVVMGHAKMIATGEESRAEERESARVIGEQAARMAGIIRSLLDFARRGTPKLEVSDLRPVVERTLRMLSAGAQRSRATLKYDAPQEPILVRMDEGQIQQVMTNMLVNALHAMPRGGEVAIALEPVRAAPPGSDDARDCVRITIADQGEGIAPEHLPRLYEPFFTTKRVGEGTGLGLPVSYGIVQEHGGWIDVHSVVGQGTRFAIYLPRAAATGPAA